MRGGEGGRGCVATREEGSQGRMRERGTYFDVFMGDARWSAPVHKLLQVKVQVLEDQEQLPLTMQHLNQAEMKAL